MTVSSFLRTPADVDAETLLSSYLALPPENPRRSAQRDKVICAWRPMAHRLARRYAHRGEALEDLQQTAVLGLIAAVDRFDPARGEFVGFAVPTILGELKRHFRDRTWVVHVPRRLHDLHAAIRAADQHLTRVLEHRPTVADIASYLDMTEEQIIEGLEVDRAYRPASLSKPVGGDGTGELSDFIGSHEAGYRATELRLSLAPAIAELSEREQRIITLRFYGNQTQTQIAASIGVSQMHISRLLSQALRKLSSLLGPEAR